MSEVGAGGLGAWTKRTNQMPFGRSDLRIPWQRSNHHSWVHGMRRLMWFCVQMEYCHANNGPIMKLLWYCKAALSSTQRHLSEATGLFQALKFLKCFLLFIFLYNFCCFVNLVFFCCFDPSFILLKNKHYNPDVLDGNSLSVWLNILNTKSFPKVEKKKNKSVKEMGVCV